MLPEFSSVGVGVMLSDFTAVGAAFYTTGECKCCPNSRAVGVGIMLHDFTALGAAITLRLGPMLADFLPLV